MSAEEISNHILLLTQRLLDAIGSGDYSTYQSLCDSTLTAFEPEAEGVLLEGLGFHRFFFDSPGDRAELKNTIASPRIRLIGTNNTVAVITFIRLVQRYDLKTKAISISKITETRVWERQSSSNRYHHPLGEWKHVHFHRSGAHSKL